MRLTLADVLKLVLLLIVVFVILNAMH